MNRLDRLRTAAPALTAVGIEVLTPGPACCAGCAVAGTPHQRFIWAYRKHEDELFPTFWNDPPPSCPIEGILYYELGGMEFDHFVHVVVEALESVGFDVTAPRHVNQPFLVDIARFDPLA